MYGFCLFLLCLINIFFHDKFPTITPYEMPRIMEHKIGTLSGEYNCKDYEIKRKILETILKKIKKGKASGEENVPSEL